MEDVKTGWERDNRTHFDEIVVNYDKARWDYPAALFKNIFEYSCKMGKKALEIGAGTGKATAPFLCAGYNVTAVELGANMAQFLREKFKRYADFNVIVEEFENAELAEKSYDLIYAASAFHWVDAQIGCPKVFNLLKSGGTFALMRANPKTADGEAHYEEIQEAYKKYYYTYYTQKERFSRNSDEDLKTREGLRDGFGFKDLSKYNFTDISLNFYEKTLYYSADEYVALMDTMSDHRALPHSNRMALYDGIREAIARNGGQNKVDYIFALYMGRKP